jgi:hypothetical protein
MLCPLLLQVLMRVASALALCCAAPVPKKIFPVTIPACNAHLYVSSLAVGADEGDISTGFVLCSLKDPTPMVSTFECQLVILELLEHNPIFTVGYR